VPQSQTGPATGQAPKRACNGGNTIIIDSDIEELASRDNCPSDATDGDVNMSDTEENPEEPVNSEDELGETLGDLDGLWLVTGRRASSQRLDSPCLRFLSTSS
jgi:hypothetical protein